MLAFGSYNCERVVVSVLADESYSFADFLDAVFLPHNKLMCILGQTISIVLLRDSKLPFNMIVLVTSIEKRRLVIDLTSRREACNGLLERKRKFGPHEYQADEKMNVPFIASSQKEVAVWTCQLD